MFQKNYAALDKYTLHMFYTCSLFEAKDPATAKRALHVKTMDTCSALLFSTSCKSARVGPIRPSLRPYNKFGQFKLYLEDYVLPLKIKSITLM